MVCVGSESWTLFFEVVDFSSSERRTAQRPTQEGQTNTFKKKKKKKKMMKMQGLGALDSVRVAPSASLAFSGAGGKQLNSTPVLPLRNSSTPLAASLVFNLPNASFFRPSSTSSRTSSFRCFSALSPELKTTLDKVVTSQKVVLFMKGTKDFPQCGFSHTVVQILKSLNVPFETINILENELLRQGLKEYSSWPTFPQLYIDGEFFGGCDITVDAYKSGELQELLEKAMCS